jgi:hypothetical protein
MENVMGDLCDVAKMFDKYRVSCYHPRFEATKVGYSWSNQVDGHVELLADEAHTISVLKCNTVIVALQHHDRVRHLLRRCRHVRGG